MNIVYIVVIREKLGKYDFNHHIQCVYNNIDAATNHVKGLKERIYHQLDDNVSVEIVEERLETDSILAGNMEAINE